MARSLSENVGQFMLFGSTPSVASLAGARASPHVAGLRRGEGAALAMHDVALILMLWRLGCRVFTLIIILPPHALPLSPRLLEIGKSFTEVKIRISSI